MTLRSLEVFPFNPGSSPTRVPSTDGVMARSLAAATAESIAVPSGARYVRDAGYLCDLRFGDGDDSRRCDRRLGFRASAFWARPLAFFGIGCGDHQRHRFVNTDRDCNVFQGVDRATPSFRHIKCAFTAG